MTRVLGVDLGARRIGLAVSDASRTLATPLGVIERAGDERADHDAILAAARDEEATTIVVGMPRSLSGDRGPAARAAAEEIDEIAGSFSARLSGEDAELAQRISDRVITIFEACNFQDITGQRISKVVGSMKFIEERVTQMAHIWGGLESFNDVEAFTMPEREGDEALLNGPALDSDPARTSQDAIDALFG